MTDKERVVYLEGQVSMLTNALATARALAMEQAARQAEIHDQYGLAVVLRNLAPLPPSLCAVPRETIEKVKDALALHSEAIDLGGDNCFMCSALAALKDLP